MLIVASPIRLVKPQAIQPKALVDAIFTELQAKYPSKAGLSTKIAQEVLALEGNDNPTPTEIKKKHDAITATRRRGKGNLNTILVLAAVADLEVKLVRRREETVL